MSLRRAIQWDAAPSGHVSLECQPNTVSQPPSSERLWRFVSFCFRASAPSDAIVARLLALDALDCVRVIHFGTNCSPEGEARGHTHAFIITFHDAIARDAYLVDPAHIAFTNFVAPYVEDVFVFDFVS